MTFEWSTSPVEPMIGLAYGPAVPGFMERNRGLVNYIDPLRLAEILKAVGKLADDACTLFHFPQ